MPEEPKLPTYRVKPGKSINQTGKILREGETLELPRHVAFELRSFLEPVDEADAFPVTRSDVRQGVEASVDVRDHEREQVLEIKKQDLENQIKFIDLQLGEIRASREERQQKEASAKKASQPKAPAPQPADK
jgi:hypothetical protein